jgi:poly(A) polymerase
LFKKIIRKARRLFRRPKATSGHVIARADHTISRSVISSSALKVLYRLKEAGYEAYLVGGGVRDTLLGRKPKDFDVATDAHPEAVRKVFRNSRIIGRRFRLVHVFFGDEIIEVSTFRANMAEDARSETTVHAETGMIKRDNTYGTMEEDAWRRDFTVNALYYNIADFSVVDYMNGMQDIKYRLIRIIGDPKQRFHEDPVRLLRAIRLAAKLQFDIEKETESAVKTLSHLLKHVATARIFDECIKLFFDGNAWITYQHLVHYHYMDALFPQTMKILRGQKNKINDELVRLVMQSTDTRVALNESVNPGFLYAVLLWPVLQSHITRMKNKKDKFYMRLHQLIHDVITKQVETVLISKRFQFVIQTIWILQFHLIKRRPNRIMTIYENRYFRAALDFMGLRVQAGEITGEHFEWWKRFAALSPEEQEKMVEQMRPSS